MTADQPEAPGRSGALCDLMVLDLGHYLAGPYSASLLAGLGAAVIKIERPRTGDGARALGPFPGDDPHPEKGGLFSYLNLNKQGITLDLKMPEGKEILRQLIRQSDVLVENFAPRVMPSLDLAYASLRELNPRLVMTSISNFGQTGPYRDYKGYEITLNALSGVQFEIGEPDREPLKLGGQQLQFQAGLVAAIATLSAVVYRDVTGRGQHLDIAIAEVGATMKGAPTTFFQFNGMDRLRNGLRPMNDTVPRPGDPPRDPRNPGMYPIAILPCKDGLVCVDPERPEQWLALCDMIGRPELKEDPRFSWAQRGANADLVDAVIMEYLRDKTQRELFEEATAWHIPFGIVNDMATLSHDPQHRERRFFVAVDHPLLGELEYPGHPFIMSETPWSVTSGAPLLGQHNRAVLSDLLGYSDEQVKLLAEKGVI